MYNSNFISDRNINFTLVTNFHASASPKPFEKFGQRCIRCRANTRKHLENVILRLVLVHTLNSKGIALDRRENNPILFTRSYAAYALGESLGRQLRR